MTNFSERENHHLARSFLQKEEGSVRHCTCWPEWAAGKPVSRPVHKTRACRDGKDDAERCNLFYYKQHEHQQSLSEPTVAGAMTTPAEAATPCTRLLILLVLHTKVVSLCCYLQIGIFCQNIPAFVSHTVEEEAAFTQPTILTSAITGGRWGFHPVWASRSKLSSCGPALWVHQAGNRNFACRGRCCNALTHCVR